MSQRTCLSLILVVVCMLSGGVRGQITNGSFEMGLNSWLVTNAPGAAPALAAVGAGTSTWATLFSSMPTDGTLAAFHPWDGAGPGQFVLEQDALVSDVNLVFDWRAGYDLTFACGACAQNREFRVDIEPAGGGTALQSDLIYTALINTLVNDSGAMTSTIDVSAYLGTTVRVKFIWTVPETFTGPAAAQLDAVRFGPAIGAWQVNSANASGDIDGVMINSTFAAQPATTTVIVGSVSTATISTALTGNGHEIAVGSAPLVPSGFLTAGGQVVNIDLSDPSLQFIFGGMNVGSSPLPGSYTVPVVMGTPGTLSAQILVVDAGNPDGFTLTQGVQHQAVVCSLLENFDALVGTSPIGWQNPSSGVANAVGWTVDANGTPSLNTGPTSAFSGSNYFYCETSGSNQAATFVFDTCYYDLSSLANFNLDFALSRIGATIGTLNIYGDEGSGNYATLLATYTGADPTQGQGGTEWSNESVSLINIPGLTSVVSVRFVYTAGGSFTGDLAIDDVTAN